MFGRDTTSSVTSGMTSGSAPSTSGDDLIRQTVRVVFSTSQGSGDGSGDESGSGMETITFQREKRMPISGHKVSEPIAPATSKAVGTPGWMIITGFIIGLAALVIVFVAIATRHSWNGPTQATQLQGKTNASTQQRELETFLHKESPKENGHASEYTVIPLEELPKKCPSH
ncbi:uncharacterized protein AB9W97_011168 [Spinachia spinachia]